MGSKQQDIASFKTFLSEKGYGPSAFAAAPSKTQEALYNSWAKQNKGTGPSLRTMRVEMGRGLKADRERATASDFLSFLGESGVTRDQYLAASTERKQAFITSWRKAKGRKTGPSANSMDRIVRGYAAPKGVDASRARRAASADSLARPGDPGFVGPVRPATPDASDAHKQRRAGIAPTPTAPTPTAPAAPTQEQSEFDAMMEFLFGTPGSGGGLISALTGGGGGSGGGGGGGGGGVTRGTIDAYKANLRQTAQEFLVPMSEESLEAWAVKMANGTLGEDAFQQEMVKKAKGLFPTLANQLDQGFSTRQAVGDYAETAAKVLEISPNQIDFNDPKFRRAIEQIDEGGNRRLLSLADAETYFRSLPEWKTTKNYAAQKAAVETRIAELFGKIGT